MNIAIRRLALLGLAVGCLPATASDLRRSERVVLYPVPAWRASNAWEADLHGCVYEPESRNVTLSVLRRALGFDEADLSPAELARYRERARLFLVDHQDDRTLNVRLARQRYRLGPSADNGHFVQRVRFPGDLPGDQEKRLRVEALLPRGRQEVAADVFLLSEEGLSVVSDLDDTIKISQVRDRGELLRNTFCRPFASVPGMAALYESWARDHRASFHYVSASPWQLYSPLAEFVRSNGFPAGTFHLRHFRVKDETFLNLFQSPEPHKREAIESLLERYPRRRFVFVGDSGERDPEVYADIARRHPVQVQRIFIRDVTGEQASTPRYATAFGGLPAGLWRVFKEPSEIRAGLDLRGAAAPARPK